jgi:AraC-like DNA-binding protein/mannose-6-phosphate isomerase-like protein (cupin superfamily)
MVQRPFHDDMSTVEPTATGWSYWRPGLDGVVEVGTLRGSEVGLPTHFHGETQITFVLSGRRRFLIRGELITLAPGQGTLIPAGVAHRSLAEPCGVACLNVYAPAGEYDVVAIMHEAERMWSKMGHMRCAELAAVVRERRRGAGGCTPTSITVPADAVGPGPVSWAAARAGMSREGFSRMFARHHGMPPHAFWLMARLNHARELLRAGEGIAEVAAEAGFTDQSHLGRWFRRAFGVTPGRYRSGWSQSQSQTCQTRR